MDSILETVTKKRNPQMSCCKAPAYLAITYHRDRQLTQVSEVMCTNCFNIVSIYDVKNRSGKYEIKKEAGEENS
jgi:hypothetical protein